ncbi:MAG: hypothetical protein KY457_07990, partial [Actinobacteria bacterium]|nr:hypothetical protein [Actinomycetota bacterium]
GGIRVWENTGALWRIRRTSAVAGEAPPPARVVPSYAIKLVAGVVTGVAAIVTAVVRRRRRD